MRELLYADGLDDAILNVDNEKQKVVYSTKGIIKILMDRDGMSFEEALEFFEFNIKEAYVGVRTPLYVDDLD